MSLGASPAPPKTVLFFMRNATGYFRIFQPVLRELLRRGHRVHVALDQRDELGGDAWLEDLTREFPAFTHRPQRSLRLSKWHALARNLRLSRDFIEAMRSDLAQAPELLGRAERRAPDAVRRVFQLRRLRRPGALRASSRALRVAEEAVPAFGPVRRVIRGVRPDVVLVAPHLMPGSLHTMYVRAAQSLGIRTVVCVASWDNLSSKQLLRVEPDSVLVWNETQRQEAIELHDVPAERIVVTGAQCYDHWFDWKPRSREEFCARVGLDAERPYVLYIGGSLFPAETTEAEFAARWICALRSSDDAGLSDLAVLIRPHPKRGEEWEAIDFARSQGVRIWPRGGRMPVRDDAKADFFDSIYHSAAVVGVNTSAMIEAAIVGRPVLTVLLPEFAGSQIGVFHFKYLTDVGGGFLRVARTLDEHLQQLGAAVAEGPEAAPERARGFVEAFVRPHGLEVPATPIFADEVERVAALGKAGRRTLSVARMPVTLMLLPLAAVLDLRHRRRVAKKKRRAALKRQMA